MSLKLFLSSGFAESLKQAVGHEAIKLMVNVDEDDYEAGRLKLLANLVDWITFGEYHVLLLNCASLELKISKRQRMGNSQLGRLVFCSSPSRSDLGLEVCSALPCSKLGTYCDQNVLNFIIAKLISKERNHWMQTYYVVQELIVIRNRVTGTESNFASLHVLIVWCETENDLVCFLFCFHVINVLFSWNKRWLGKPSCLYSTCLPAAVKLRIFFLIALDFAGYLKFYGGKSDIYFIDLILALPCSGGDRTCSFYFLLMYSSLKSHLMVDNDKTLSHRNKDPELNDSDRHLCPKVMNPGRISISIRIHSSPWKV